MRYPEQGSAWIRRMKIPLTGVDPTLGAQWEAAVSGRGPDGLMACARVPLIGGGWRPR